VLHAPIASIMTKWGVGRRKYLTQESYTSMKCFRYTVQTRTTNSFTIYMELYVSWLHSLIKYLVLWWCVGIMFENNSCCRYGNLQRKFTFSSFSRARSIVLRSAILKANIREDHCAFVTSSHVWSWMPPYFFILKKIRKEIGMIVRAKVELIKYPLR